MAGRLVIRRLRLSGLVPRDHPGPHDLAGRLRDAAQSLLGAALGDAANWYSGAGVLRIRRLEVDVSMLAAFDPGAFAELLARAIIAALRRAEVSGSSESSGVMAYPTRAAYIAALVEALVAGRATDCWWLSDAEGLRFLPRAMAIRTALLADPADGIEALASLPPSRLAPVLSVLTPVEADRILDGFAAGGNASPVGADACVSVLADAAAALPAPGSALLLYLRVWARHPEIVGPTVADAARAWVEMASEMAEPPGASLRPDTSVTSPRLPGATAFDATMPRDDPSQSIRTAVARHLGHRRATSTGGTQPTPEPLFSAFGGLLLLVPTVPMMEITEAVEDPEAAALVAFAAIGLCAGRRRFGAWLEEVPWRALLGIDVQAPGRVLAGRLAAIRGERWAKLAALGGAPDNPRDARFLLLPHDLTGSRVAARALAGLAREIAARFARRLIGFGDASVPFLWENLLGSGAALRRGPGEWEARLTRPPLDVLLSLSRIVEGSVVFPSGIRVRLARVSA